MAKRAATAPSTTGDTAGRKTRELLLTAAGEVFAEKGYDRSTSREICDRAGVNTAAANYYFGGIEGLYGAAMAQAHRCLMHIEALQQLVAAPIEPRAKLKALIEMMVRRLTEPHVGWEVRLMAREIISPSSLRKAFVETEVLPKLHLVRVILGQVMGLPPDDPKVGRSVVNVAAPYLLLMIGDPRIIETLVPALGEGDRAERLAEHMVTYALDGLAAVAKAGPTAD